MPTALVIEDDPTAADGLCQLLRLLDVATRPAYTHHAALLSLAEALPDLIFLDLDFSGGEGFEILSRIGRDDLLREIPVIAMTAVTTEGINPFCQGANLIGVIHPPASLQAVTQALQKGGVV